MRPLLALLVVLSACSEIESPSIAKNCFREDPETFAAKEESSLRAEIVTPDRPACKGSVSDGRAVCAVRVEAYIDADGHAVKLTTATTRGVNARGEYTEQLVGCKLTCSGQACLMGGCSAGGENCTGFDCGPGCTGSCTKTDGPLPEDPPQNL